MKIQKVGIFLVGVLLCASCAWAEKVPVATKEDVLFLKRDVLAGRIQLGKTRLKDFRKLYGDAPNITDADKSVVYDYGDIKITFDKKQYMIKWVYDFSHTPRYSEDIDDLRSDLEDGELVGNFITIDKIRKDYGEPTEIFEKNGDGEKSVYFYGEIGLTFENIYTVKSWKGAALDKTIETDVLQTPESFTSAPVKVEGKPEVQAMEQKTPQPAPVAATTTAESAPPAEVAPAEEVTVQTTMQKTE